MCNLENTGPLAGVALLVGTLSPAREGFAFAPGREAIN